MATKGFEEVYKKREEMALAGLEKGLPLVAISYRDGIVLVTRNRSATLNKIREVHDTIAFGAVGARYPEINTVQGLLEASISGIEGILAPEDVDARFLAEELMSNVHNQLVDQRRKPFEISVVLAELSKNGPSVFYRIMPNGGMDELERFAVLADEEREILIARVLEEGWNTALTLESAISFAKQSFEKVDETLSSDSIWEIGVLDRRERNERKFRYVKEETSHAPKAREAAKTGKTGKRVSSAASTGQ